MTAQRHASEGLWPRAYATALATAGLALLALAPLSHQLFSSADLEQQAVAAVAARHMLQPLLGAAWLLGAFMLLGGVYWLVRSLRWAVLLSVTAAALLSAGAVAGSSRLSGPPSKIHPALSLEIPAQAGLLPELRRRLYAYAQREGLGFEDRSARMAQRQNRPDALWVEFKRDGVTVAVASDLLHPGRAVIQFYGDAKDGSVWKERLAVELAAMWPEMAVVTP